MGPVIQTKERRRKLRSKLLVLSVWLSLVAISLLLTNCNAPLQRNGWDDEWGPLVSHQSFPADCSLCHYPDSWTQLKPDFNFDHQAETGYALNGAHSNAMCLRCHNDRGDVTTFVAYGCAGCHGDPHGGNLGNDCVQCHSETDWQPTGLIREHAETRFPLFGVHATLPCDLCHNQAQTGIFRGAPTECESCHQRDLRRTQFPDHLATGLTTECERCHTPNGWSGPGAINHDFFPLLGGHARDCSSCHLPGSFGGLSQDCYGCHQDDYQGADNHETFPTTCQNCHNIFNWGDANINHDFFPLVGGHNRGCASCHNGGTFAGLSQDCYSCHANDYNNADNHDSFPTTCQDCHNVFDWDDANFAHSFPLQGPHNRDCNDCHLGNTATFSCYGTCHEHSQSRCDNDHDDVNNYVYEFNACLSCHPDGND